jgi:hypothetical protein
MLQAATTAYTEMGTLRLNPVGRWTKHCGGTALVELAVGCQVLEGDFFAGQGTIDKNRLAVTVRHPATVMRERLDRDPLARTWQPLSAGAFTHLKGNIYPGYEAFTAETPRTQSGQIIKICVKNMC